MTFKLTASLTAGLFFYLAAVLLITPATHMGFLGITPDAGGIAMGRRTAPAFFAIAILLWLMRDEPVGMFRAKLSMAVTVMMVVVAAIGIHAYATGAASSAILGAVAVEALVALGFIRFAMGR